LPKRLDAVGQQKSAAPHAGGSKSGLGASVAATDHDDVEFDRKLHGEGAILRHRSTWN
jgi:hypothetical protein